MLAESRKVTKYIPERDEIEALQHCIGMLNGWKNFIEVEDDSQGSEIPWEIDSAIKALGVVKRRFSDGAETVIHIL